VKTMNNNLLQLNPQTGDIYKLTYRFKVEGEGGTARLRSYFRETDLLSLLQVKTDPARESIFTVRVRVDREIDNANALFNVPEFKFKSLKEKESIFRRAIGTLVGFFMGG